MCKTLASRSPDLPPGQPVELQRGLRLPKQSPGAELSWENDVKVKDGSPTARKQMHTLRLAEWALERSSKHFRSKSSPGLGARLPTNWHLPPHAAPSGHRKAEDTVSYSQTVAMMGRPTGSDNLGRGKSSGKNKRGTNNKHQRPIFAQVNSVTLPKNTSFRSRAMNTWKGQNKKKTEESQIQMTSQTRQVTKMGDTDWLKIRSAHLWVLGPAGIGEDVHFKGGHHSNPQTVFSIQRLRFTELTWFFKKSWIVMFNPPILKY